MNPLVLYAVLAGATPLVAAFLARALGRMAFLHSKDKSLLAGIALLGISSGMLFAVATLDLVPEALGVAQGEAIELSRWVVAGSEDAVEGEKLLDPSLRQNHPDCVSIATARAHDHLQLEGLETGVRFSMMGIFVGFLSMMLIEQVLEMFGASHSHSHDGGQHHRDMEVVLPEKGERGNSGILSKSMNVAVLAGLAVHAFVDGIMIAGAFKASSDIGVRVGIAVVIHKFPDGAMLSAILQQAALRKIPKKICRFLPAIADDNYWMLGICAMTPLGALIGYMLLGGMPDIWLGGVLGFGAGSFLFITCVGILPELLKFENKRLSLGCFVLGYFCFLVTDTVFSGPH